MSRHTRRTFLKRVTAAGIGATFAISGTKASGKILGANETIRIGVAGINGRGSAHIEAFAKMPNVEVAYLIDPDSRLFAMRSKQIEKATGYQPKCVQDIRKALEDKDLDAVSVATCNHWHSLITIWACQAGKDVYVEKPCSHNVYEGRKCVEAARKYNRIVQHGTQSRSSAGTAKEAAAARSGKYGKLLVAKGYCCKVRWSIGFKDVTQPPPELDFNLWLGPAPEQPYHENLVHYNWHWFWDTGNGDMGNQGVHQMDIARWGIPNGTLPKAVLGMGGRWVEGPDFKDQGQTPNMELCIYDYGDMLLVFETRGLVGKKGPAGKEFPTKVTNEFYTDAGVIRDGKFFPNGQEQGEELKDVEFKVQPNGQFGNFIDCVRSRKQEELNAEILEGHLSAALCHLGNTSYRLGQQVPFSQTPDCYFDNAQVRQSWDMIKENLTGTLGANLDQMTYQLGPRLEFDPASEKFVGNDDANKLLTRKYREPFVVPESV
jgi:predicted dehydrogenase